MVGKFHHQCTFQGGVQHVTDQLRAAVLELFPWQTTAQKKVISGCGGMFCYYLMFGANTPRHAHKHAIFSDAWLTNEGGYDSTRIIICSGSLHSCVCTTWVKFSPCQGEIYTAIPVCSLSSRFPSPPSAWHTRHRVSKD